VELLGQLFRELSTSTRPIRPRRKLINTWLAALAPQAIEGQQYPTKYETSAMMTIHHDVAGKMTYNYHLQQFLTSIDVECMEKIMNLLHAAFSTQIGNDSTSPIKE
jgi:hypothetical protein